jgi:hypothetical protein
MPPGAMTKRELVDRLLDGRLADYVNSRRAQKPSRSWARIAGDLRSDYDIEVSDEALREWFGKTEDSDNDATVGAA